MGFFRQEYWSGLPFPSPGGSFLPRDRTQVSRIVGRRFYLLSHQEKKTIALTIWNFVSVVMSLLFNMLSRFVKAFLSRSKCLLISWLQCPSTVILEPRKIKSVTVSIVSPSICREVMGPDAMILVFQTLSFKATLSPSPGGSPVPLPFLLFR